MSLALALALIGALLLSWATVPIEQEQEETIPALTQEAVIRLPFPTPTRIPPPYCVGRGDFCPFTTITETIMQTRYVLTFRFPQADKRTETSTTDICDAFTVLYEWGQNARTHEWQQEFDGVAITGCDSLAPPTVTGLIGYTYYPITVTEVVTKRVRTDDQDADLPSAPAD